MNRPAHFRRRVFVAGHAFVAGLFALALLCGLPATAQTDSRIKAILASINQAYAAIAGKTESQAGSACGQIVSKIMDMEALTKGASTRIWDSMSPTQRGAFRVAAQRWVERTCVKRNQDNSGDPLEFVGVRAGESGDQLLATRSKNPVHFLIWRLRGAGKLRAVDLQLDGASLMLALRDDMTAVLEQNNNDMDKAIAALGR